MTMDGLEIGDDAPGDRKSRAATRLKVAGAALAVTLGSLWLLRFPLLNLAAQGYLGGRGVDADFNSDAITPHRLEIRDLRLGPADHPDFTAKRVALSLRWDGLLPEVAGIVLDRPVARLRLDADGLSLGTLDRLLPPPSDEPLQVPPMAVVARAGRLIADTPLGPVTLRFESAGTLTRDFVATARLEPARIGNDRLRLERLRADARLTSGPRGLALTLDGDAQLAVAGAGPDAPRLDRPTLHLGGTADAALTTLNGAATLAAATARSGATTVDAPTTTLTLDGLRLDPRGRPLAWSATLEAVAGDVRAPAAAIAAPKATLTLTGKSDGADGRWQFASGRLTGGASTPLATAETARADGTLRLDRTATGVFADGTGTVAVPDAALSPALRRQLRTRADSLGPTPLGPLATDGSQALERAGRSFGLELPLAFDWRAGAGEITVPGTVTLRAASGARLELADGDGPVARITLPNGRLSINGRTSLAGGGLPVIEGVIAHQAATPGDPGHHSLRLVVDRWNAGDGDRQASLRVPSLAVTLRQDDGVPRLDVSGALTLSGPLGGRARPQGHVRDLDLPLDLTARLGPDLAVAPREGCMVVTMRDLQLGATDLGGAALPLCPQGGAFFSRTAGGRLGGGIATPSLLLAADRGPARLETGPAALRFTGTAAAPRLEAMVQAPSAELTLEGGRAVAARATMVAATLVGDAGGWRASGALAGISARDGGSGVALRDGEARWEAGARNGAAASARLTGLTALIADTGAEPMFSPLRLTDVEARLSDGILHAGGVVRLAAGGTRLGGWRLAHNLDTGTGDAAFTVSDFVFSPELQPYQLSELARGVIENVSGSIGGVARARWTARGMRSDGEVMLGGLSFATAALGPIDGVSGTVRFDNLTPLTTPPGQTLTVAKINPGVAVSDGVLRFQLQPGFKIALEDVHWPFAGGTLAVAPAVIDPAADSRTLTLTLADIDVATFLAQMQLDSLAATGKVEGAMPLVLTDTGAAIRGGQLRSKDGGLIAYTGDVGRNGELGQGQIAFDALRSFRYDSIVFEVDGDLAGDLVTAIRFAGVTKADVAPVQSVKMLKLSGVPFKFNVNVRAPFGRLARSFAEFSQPDKALKQALEEDAAAAAAAAADLQKPQ